MRQKEKQSELGLQICKVTARFNKYNSINKKKK